MLFGKKTSCIIGRVFVFQKENRIILFYALSMEDYMFCKMYTLTLGNMVI